MPVCTMLLPDPGGARRTLAQPLSPIYVADIGSGYLEDWYQSHQVGNHSVQLHSIE